MKKNNGENGEVQKIPRKRAKRDLLVLDLTGRPELRDRMDRAVRKTGRIQSDIMEEALEIHLRKLAPSTRVGVSERAKKLAAERGQTETEVMDQALIVYAAQVETDAEQRREDRQGDYDLSERDSRP